MRHNVAQDDLWENARLRTLLTTVFKVCRAAAVAAAREARMQRVSVRCDVVQCDMNILNGNEHVVKCNV